MKHIDSSFERSHAAYNLARKQDGSYVCIFTQLAQAFRHFYR